MKPTLLRTLVIVGILTCLAAAVGPVINRLRDLGDVRLATTPSNGQTLVYNTSLVRWTNGVASGGSATNAPVVSQNGTNGGVEINVIDTVTVTWAKSGSNWTATVVAIGAPGVTNYYDYSIITNLTTILTNIFNVAKGGHLTVYSNLTVLQAGPSKLLRTDSNTNVASTTIGNGLAFDGTTLYSTNLAESQLALTDVTTANASTTKHGFAPKYPNDATKYLDGTGAYSVPAGGGGGGASVWVPNTALTYSGGTNLTIDGSGGTNFFVTLTNTAFFVTPSNVPASKATNTSFQVWFMQDGTGGRLVTWTNASFKFPGGSTAAFQPLTNANAVSYISFSMSPFTNGIFVADYGVLDSR